MENKQNYTLEMKELEIAEEENEKFDFDNLEELE